MKSILLLAVTFVTITVGAIAVLADVGAPEVPITVTNYGKKAVVTFDHAQHTAQGVDYTFQRLPVGQGRPGQHARRRRVQHAPLSRLRRRGRRAGPMAVPQHPPHRRVHRQPGHIQACHHLAHRTRYQIEAGTIAGLADPSAEPAGSRVPTPSAASRRYGCRAVAVCRMVPAESSDRSAPHRR